MLERKMAFPVMLSTQFREFLQRSVEVTQQATLAIGEVENLINSEFQNNQIKLVENRILELDQLEQQTDEMQGRLRSKLFDIENTLSPLDAFFLYKIIEWIGELADNAQHVGEQLQLLLVR